MSQKSALQQAKSNAAANTIAVVPVRFHVVLPTNGSSTIDNAYVESALANLEQKFSSSTYSYDFVLCGDINYIKNNSFYFGVVPIQDFSYTSLTANVYIGNFGNTYADFPWFGNRIFLSTTDLLSPVFPHEFGHHFGLIHTFDPSVTYHVPTNPSDIYSQIDHPYNDHPDALPRELVIRENTAGLVFPTANSTHAGDLVHATPAGCNPSSAGPNGTHPGCSFNMGNCSYNGTYLDYNLMPIDDPTNLLAKNLMSYGTGNCRTEFVEEQKDRAFGYYESIRKYQYRPQSCGDLEDKVEFEGTNQGMKNVSVKLTHTGGAPTSFALTDDAGGFDGVLFNNSLSNGVTANVRKLGSNPNFTFTLANWLDGVTTFDLVTVTRHILVLSPLNGYQQIAADVNNSNSVTTFDAVQIRKLILQQISSFVAFDQPWRFIREDIPLNNPSDFDGGWDDNPFQYANLDGHDVYPVAGLNGKAGFDAVKLGDVNASNSEADLLGEEPSSLGDPIYVDIVKMANGNQDVYDFKVSDFEDIVAYQLDVQFTQEHLEYVQSLERELEGVNPEFFGETDAEEGILRTLWYDEGALTPVTLEDLDRIFSLVFDRLGNSPSGEVNILQSVGFRSAEGVSSLRSFAITSNGTIRPIIQRDFSDDKIASITTSPNPFTDEVVVAVEAMQGGEVQVCLFNATGQQVHASVAALSKGGNQFRLGGLGDLPEGFYLFTLVSDGKSFSRKLVKSSK